MLSLPTRAAGERQYARREERRVSTDSSPRARSIVLADRVDDVPRCVHGFPQPCFFCSRSYWPLMLWFGRLDVGARARGGRPRYATSASPLVPRPRGRARNPPHAGRRSIRLAARALRMESSCRRTHPGIRWQQGRLRLAGTVGARRCQCPRHLFCHSRPIRRRRTVHRAPVGCAVDAIAGCSSSSLSGAAPALHHASTPASVG